MRDPIERQAAIDAVCLNNYHDITLVNGKPYTRGYRDGVLAKENDCIENIMNLPSAQPDNHEVACLLAELFDDTCACNFNDIDEWLPEKCEFIDSCPNPGGVTCWEQFLKHRGGRRNDERMGNS